MKIFYRWRSGCVHYLLSILEKLFLNKCYYSIDDLPVFNWWQIHEKGNVYLLYPNKVRKLWIKKILLAKLWEKVYDQFIQRFGLGETFKNILKKKKYIAITKINKMITGDKSLTTLIEVAKFELAELENATGSDFLYTKSNLEKIMGFQINTKKTSVSEFYTYINLAKT